MFARSADFHTLVSFFTNTDMNLKLFPKASSHQYLSFDIQDLCVKCLTNDDIQDINILIKTKKVSLVKKWHFLGVREVD